MPRPRPRSAGAPPDVGTPPTTPQAPIDRAAPGCAALGWAASAERMAYGHNARIFDVAPAPAASTAFAGWLASASEDDAVRLWRPREAGGGGGGTDTDFDLAAAFRGHSDPVLRVAWHASSPDSGLLASSSGDRTARLWRVEERGGGRWATAPVATLGGHVEEVYACEFLGGGADVSSGGGGGGGGGSGPPLRLVTASGPGLVGWEVRPDGEPVRVGDSPPCAVGLDSDPSSSSTPLPPRWAAAHIFCAASQPGAPSHPLIAAACSDGALRLWAAGGSAAAFTPVLGVRVHPGAVCSSLAWTADGVGLAVGAADGSLALLDVRKPTQAVWRGGGGEGGGGPAYGCAFVERRERRGGGGRGGAASPPSPADPRPTAVLAVAGGSSTVSLFDCAPPSSPSPAPVDRLVAARAPPHRLLCVAAGCGGAVVTAGEAVEGAGPGHAGGVSSSGGDRPAVVWTTAAEGGDAPPPADHAAPHKKALWAPVTVFEAAASSVFVRD